MDMSEHKPRGVICPQLSEPHEPLAEPIDQESVDQGEGVYCACNRRMARALAALLERPGIHFAVVGAGHVVGPEGIPAAMRTTSPRDHEAIQTPSSRIILRLDAYAFD
jgi:hypothetical protein